MEMEPPPKMALALDAPCMAYLALLYRTRLPSRLWRIRKTWPSGEYSGVSCANHMLHEAAARMAGSAHGVFVAGYQQAMMNAQTCCIWLRHGRS